MSVQSVPTKSKIDTALWPHLSLLLLYTLLAIVLTWPTFAHPATHVPGDGGDDPAIAWNLWWVKYALLNTGQNPFQTDFMFYPIGINLAFYTLTVLNAVTALPLTLNFGVVLASNGHLLFTFVSGGYGAFLLARYVLATTTRPVSTGAGAAATSLLFLPTPAPVYLWSSAAIAGGFYAFASSKLFYVSLGQFNIASTHWIPFAVLYILRTRRHPCHLKNPVLAGLFLTLQAWTEMTYASFLLVFIGLYSFWEVGCWLWDYVHRSSDSQFTIRNSQFIALTHLRAALVIGFTFGLGLSPILAHMLPDLRREGDFLVEGSGFAEAFSADLLGFVIPTMHHPWLGQLIRHTNIGLPGSLTGFDKGQHIYLGFILLSLWGIGFWLNHRRSELRFWLSAAIVFGLLCLGPVIVVNSHSTGWPGPFVLLQNLPFFKGNRYPSRYSVMLILSLSVIAAFALTQIRQWANRRTILHLSFIIHHSSFTVHNLLPPLIALLFLLEHLSTPLPQSHLRAPPAYQTIAADPDQVTILDIPFAWRNGFRITGPLTTQFMLGQFYQTTHQKRLLQGNTSRNPAFKFQYFTNAPVINSLLALQTGHTLPPERWPGDKTIAAAVLRFFNLKYIVVRPYQYGKFDGQKNITVTEQATIPYIEDVLPVEKIHDEPTIKIYRVKAKPQASGGPSELHLDSASPLAPLYFGAGWGWLSPGQPITAQRQEVQLLLPLTGAAQRLTMRLRLPASFSNNRQSLQLVLNGWQSAPQPVSQDWQELTFDLPAGVAGAGLNNLTLHFANSVGVMPGFKPMQVTALSAGEEVGDFGHIFVNGRDISPNQRGYNIALIQADGTHHTANFDTHLDPAASTALARFIDIPAPNTTIALAAADEASTHLTTEAVAALHAIGVKGDLRGCFRCSHAFIRDDSGQTSEALDALRPVGVATGLGLTEPEVTALVEWIKVVEP